MTPRKPRTRAELRAEHLDLARRARKIMAFYRREGLERVAEVVWIRAMHHEKQARKLGERR